VDGVDEETLDALADDERPVTDERDGDVKNLGEVKLGL
jgi:hypothetical protein